MVSTVRSRPNHYEILGLTPTAGDDEIIRAFGRQMSMFRARPMSEAAQIGVAYETLRNPIKRQAYDASLGLRPEAERRQSPAAAAPPEGRRTGVSDGATGETSLRPAPPMNPRPRSETLPEHRLGSFIAESLREPVSEAPRDSSGAGAERKEQHRPEAQAVPSAEARVDLFRVLDREQSPARGADERPIEWKRPVAVAGALVLAAGAFGVATGWQGGQAEEPQQMVRSVSVALPPPRPLPDIAAASPAPVLARSVVQATPERPRPAAVPEPPVERTLSPPQLAASEEKQPAPTQSEESQSGEGATAQAAAESPPVAPSAANLPLPNAVMARTIERIGYACGQIASSAPVEGAAGVYKVTCTSGDSYQAGPVKGRYHFRRWGRH